MKRAHLFGTFDRWFSWLILAAAIPLCAMAEPSIPTADTEVLNIAFSEAMFSDVNMNDAKASIKAWTAALGRDLDLNVTSETRIIDRPEDLLASLLAGEIDVLATTSTEFLAVEGEVRIDPLFTGLQDGSNYEEYVLLVHRDSDLETIDDLKGRTVLFWDNPRTCLMEEWLESLCNGPVCNGDGRFFGSFSQTKKLSAVVLPVFFRQSDVCLVTLRGWQMMGELNPQIALQLRAVATSPQLVVIVLGLRADYESQYRERLIEVLQEMHESAGGRQILTLFHGDQLQQSPSSVLDSSRELLEAPGRAAPRARSGAADVTAEGTVEAAARKSLQ